MRENIDPQKLNHPALLAKEEQHQLKGEVKIDFGGIAEKYAEEIRSFLWQVKNENKNDHLQYVNPDSLNYDDLIIADKLRKGALTNKEFEEYQKSLEPYYEEMAKRHTASDYGSHDTRSNFIAWVGNIMMNQAYQRKHPEKFPGGEPLF